MKLSNLSQKRGLSQALVILPCLLGAGLAHTAPAAVNNAANNAANAVNNAANNTATAANNAANTVTEKASNAADKASSAASNMADKASAAASNAADKATTAAANASFEDSAKTAYTLTQWEIDASFITAQAMESVKSPELKKNLAALKENIEHTITDLGELTRKLGKQPPEHSRDFKGFFMQGYTAIRGIATDKGVLEAVHTNAVLALKGYEMALKANLSPEARTLIQKIYEGKKKDVEMLTAWKA